MDPALVSPDDIGYQLIVFISIFTPLQVGLVALRFYARSLTAKKYGADDWLVVAALLGQFVAAGLAIGSLKDAGVGRHIGWLQEHNPIAIVNFFKYLVAIPIWYHFTISWSKLAICLLYMQLFPQKTMRYALYVTMGIMIATAIATIIADFVECRPFEANWAPLPVQSVQCFDREALFVWSTFPNIVTDVILLVLPLPVIWKLQMSTKLKMALGITFFFGSIGLVASILRFATFANHSSFVDATYTAVELIIYTVAEPGIYLIASCLMVYRPLIERVQTFATRFDSQGYGSQGTKQYYSKHGKISHPHSSDPHASHVPLSSMSAGSQNDQLHMKGSESDKYGRATFEQRNGIRVTTDVRSGWQQA